MKNFNQIKYKDTNWKEEHLRLIEQFYKKTTYFCIYFDDFKEILLKDYNSISHLSSELIIWFLSKLNINTEIIYSSELVDEDITGADRILAILKELKATKYITGSGPGSMRYINEKDFKEAGIELEWQSYSHPRYRQINGEFIPYMNILDLLFNEGPNGIDRI